MPVSFCFLCGQLQLNKSFFLLICNFIFLRNFLFFLTADESYHLLIQDYLLPNARETHGTIFSCHVSGQRQQTYISSCVLFSLLWFCACSCAENKVHLLSKRATFDPPNLYEVLTHVNQNLLTHLTTLLNCGLHPSILFQLSNLQ